MHFKIGSKVEWKWLGRPIEGIVVEVFFEPTIKLIKGKRIKRNGSKECPAYLVKSSAGNLALKLETELSPRQRRTRSLGEVTLFLGDKIRKTTLGKD